MFVKKKLRAANKLPSTNTKTKLDLTKLIQDFHKPSITGANIMNISVICTILLLKIS